MGPHMIHSASGLPNASVMSGRERSLGEVTSCTAQRSQPPVRITVDFCRGQVTYQRVTDAPSSQA